MPKGIKVQTTATKLIAVLLKVNADAKPDFSKSVPGFVTQVDIAKMPTKDGSSMKYADTFAYGQGAVDIVSDDGSVDTCFPHVTLTIKGSRAAVNAATKQAAVATKPNETENVAAIVAAVLKAMGK